MFSPKIALRDTGSCVGGGKVERMSPVNIRRSLISLLG